MRTQPSTPTTISIPSKLQPLLVSNGPGAASVRDPYRPTSPQQQHSPAHQYRTHQNKNSNQQHQQPHPLNSSNPHHHNQSSQNAHHPHQHHQASQHLKVLSSHSRRGSSDRGNTAKEALKSKSLTTSKPIQDFVGPYVLGKTLGKGSSGCVKLACHRRTNDQVAIKIISKASLANKAAVHRGIEREIAIMKLINHPHVIQLYDVYETEKDLFLIMEYVSGGELFEYLVSRGRLDEAEALRFFQQIIVGLAFCHKRKICHRDLKPENLLLDARMNVKIADFGMASLQKSGRLLETSCGSPHYASPEIVTGMKYDGSSSDIWSCGIILYALLTGHLPFDDENIRHLLSKVKAGKFHMPSDISAGARDLISRMLTVNPKRRITMQGVISHPWFRAVNLRENTLGEPAQDPESARPMRVGELDAEIVRHMRWLFAPGPSHSNPAAKETYDEEALLQEIQEKLTNEDENMEKLFYHLLCQHKIELLENYSEDDNESIPDGPRRRADSFPNSAACSIRSAIPDFGPTPLAPRDSPLTSPSSPLSSLVKGIDPAPFILNPESGLVTSTPTHPNYINGVRRGRSPIKMNDVSSAVKEARSPSRIRRSEELENSRASFEKDSGSRAMKKEDSGRGFDIVKDEGKMTGFSPRLVPFTGPIQENLGSVQQAAAGQYRPMTPLLSHNAQLPPLHPTETSYITVGPYNEDAGRPTLTSNQGSSTGVASIESQVLSTQISVAPSPQQHLRVHGSTSNAFSAEKALSPNTCIQRPILHPLDVKTSAATMAMNIFASRHSREYSEGTASINSTTPMSPTGPKRPWFARLFDFKPQPLTFKSNVSAAETQDRVEEILRDLFQSSIHIDSYKKPTFGIKCRYDGGVIDEQSVKAVKFKVDISEKTRFLHSRSASISNGSTRSRTASSSAVAAILATVDFHQDQDQSLHAKDASSATTSSTSGPDGSRAGTGSLKRPPETVSARRASDGGSILSTAAAAVTAHLVGKVQFHSPSTSGHRHSVHIATLQGAGHPPLPDMGKKVVKVTLHQLQGANSTLKKIYEQLCAVWELQQHQLQAGDMTPTIRVPQSTAV
ncbi:hypothetical protein BGZ51_007887 [Haplosporangium sp. Z 767]|nr:hypothetical protein BGZ51_007887 [Haplosporangium sp. Z 767]